MKTRRRLSPFPSTEEDESYLARNRRRAWFALAAAVEDMERGPTSEARAWAQINAFRCLKRLRSLKVTREDPNPNRRVVIGEVVPQAPRRAVVG